MSPISLNALFLALGNNRTETVDRQPSVEEETPTLVDETTVEEKKIPVGLITAFMMENIKEPDFSTLKE